MAEESKFLNLLLIVLFSGAIVAIGAHELHKKFLAKQGAHSAKEMIQQLQGEVDPMRASLSRHATEESRSEETHSEKAKSGLQDMLDRVLP